MTERPILFSAPMVRALLDGRKTQTRRALKPQPGPEVTSAGVLSRSGEGQLDEWTWLGGDPRDIDTWEVFDDFKVRFRPGDRLWVKERCFIPPAHVSERDMRDGADTWPAAVYAADDLEGGRDMVERCRWRHRVSIHMPRWASRLTLLVTDVRVERLQDCSEADARAEGVYFKGPPDCDASTLAVDLPEGGRALGTHAVPLYQTLWNCINGAGAWEANPWVVAVSFTVEHRNIDEAANG